MFRPASGAASNTNQNAIYMDASSTSWRTRPGRTRSNSAARCCKPEASGRARTRRPRRPAGARRRRRACSAASAQFFGYGSYVAAVAEVSVSARAAEDPPHRRRDQSRPCGQPGADRRHRSQGSFVYGLCAVLFGEITIDKGGAVESNFDTYKVMRLDEMPKVETVIVPSGGFWGGVGEPTIAVAGPGGAQRDLCRDRQAHPHVAADEPRSAAAPEGAGMRSAPRRLGGARGSDGARRVPLPLRPSAAGARASCSGCHAASGAVGRRCCGWPATPAEIVAAMRGVPRRARGRRR